MKARLYGLLALMLCAMMVVMPAVAMGATNSREIRYLQGNNINVSEEDIILDGTEVKPAESVSSSGTPIRIVYDLKPEMDSAASVSEPSQSLSVLDPINNDLDQKPIGWRVKSLEQSDKNVVTYDTIYLEPVYYMLANAKAIVGGKELNVTAYDHIFEPKTSLGSYSSREAIEAAFKQYAEQNGCGSALSFREIGAYEPVVIVYNSDVVIRKLNLKNVDVIFEEYNKSPLFRANTTAHLLHMKADGTIEDKPISIVNGKYTVTLSDFSPFAIAYNPNDVSSGTTLPGGPGIAAPNLPKTGDNSQLLLWSALALLSLTGAVLSIRRKKA